MIYACKAPAAWSENPRHRRLALSPADDAGNKKHGYVRTIAVECDVKGFIPVRTTPVEDLKNMPLI